MKYAELKCRNYKGENVTVICSIGGRSAIWIPSRQEQVWVLDEKLKPAKKKPTIPGTA